MSRRSMSNTVPRRRRRNRGNRQTQASKVEVFEEKATITYKMSVGAGKGSLKINTSDLKNLIVNRYEEWRIASMTAVWVCPGGSQSAGVRALIISKTLPMADSTAVITTNGGRMVANSVPSLVSNVFKNDPNQWFGQTDTAGYIRYSYDGVAIEMMSWIELRITLHLRGYDSTVSLKNSLAPQIVEYPPRPGPPPPERPPYTPDPDDMIKAMSKCLDKVVLVNFRPFERAEAFNVVNSLTVKSPDVIGKNTAILAKSILDEYLKDIKIGNKSLQFMVRYLIFADSLVSLLYAEAENISFGAYQTWKYALEDIKFDIRPRGEPEEEGVGLSGDALEEVEDDLESIDSTNSERPPDMDILARLDSIENKSRASLRLLQSLENRGEPLSTEDLDTPWSVHATRTRFIHRLTGKRFAYEAVWKWLFMMPALGEVALPASVLLGRQVDEYMDRLNALHLKVDGYYTLVHNEGDLLTRDTMYPGTLSPILNYFDNFEREELVDTIDSIWNEEKILKAIQEGNKLNNDVVTLSVASV